MTDVFSKKKRSEVMSLIRSTNTKPEIALRKIVSISLYPRGYRYRIHYKKLLGRPDIVFVSKKVAVFVDGAFWHGYTFKQIESRLPKKYWHAKIMGNVERDQRINKALKKAGWKVIRFWEHDVLKKPDKVLKAIVAAVTAPRNR